MCLFSVETVVTDVPVSPFKSYLGSTSDGLVEKKSSCDFFETNPSLVHFLLVFKDECFNIPTFGFWTAYVLCEPT